MKKRTVYSNRDKPFIIIWDEDTSLLPGWHWKKLVSANPEFNYQFIFSLRLILGSKLDTSLFIYATERNYQRKRNFTQISQEIQTQTTQFSLRFSNLRQPQSFLLISFIHYIPFKCLFCAYSEAWLFSRVFFGEFLFVLIVPYHSPFWFPRMFPCGVLGNTQSVYYNLGTDRVKENINIGAELSVMYYALSTDLPFINSCTILLFHVRKMK